MSEERVLMISLLRLMCEGVQKSEGFKRRKRDNRRQKKHASLYSIINICKEACPKSDRF